MASKDYYRTLGVPRDASAADIKLAYRKLVRKYHPDVNKAKDAEHTTKELNEAYDVLGDPVKRAGYDRLGSRAHAGEPFAPPPSWARTDGFQQGRPERDFFSELFAHVGRRGRFRSRGEDIRATLSVDLHDSYHGATRLVSIRLQERERKLSVTIPKGVLAGQQLRIHGQGQPGVGGGEQGDLLLEIAFNPSAQYEVDGRDVRQTVPVAPWEAALGADINIPTPSGRVQVTIPAGSQSGRQLRLKGRGIPAQPPGDLYLQLDVVLPPATSAKARALYEQMGRELAFDPRRHLRG